MYREGQCRKNRSSPLNHCRRMVVRSPTPDVVYDELFPRMPPDRARSASVRFTDHSGLMEVAKGCARKEDVQRKPWARLCVEMGRIPDS